MRKYFNAQILEAETKHAKEIEEIAQRVIREADAAKIVLIGGPSSAGKTTFAKRLTFHLKNDGIAPLVISTDDYFVGDARNPRDENGKLDYEHIRAMDLEKLNEDLLNLMAGKTVTIPRFDFEKHAPAEVGHDEHLEAGGVIIIEGLHSLNPELTPRISDSSKFLILVDTVSSPFNDLEGAKPGDGRLIRRIIRDSKYRGRKPTDTIRLWDSVRAGEIRWIQPFERNAEYIFDTTLPYEPGVLKYYASPLLESIPNDDPSYAKAQQLLELMEEFKEAPEHGIPGFSILREYIGGSCIEY